MARRNHNRTGFTAIELLIVLAIVSMLGALAASAVFRVRATSERTATETTLTKLASALDVQWKAVIDSARKEYDGLPTNIKQNLITLADNQKSMQPYPHPRRDDRARLLYVKFRLKQEFPTSFAAVVDPATYGTRQYLPPNTIPGIPKPVTGKPAYIKAVVGKNLGSDKQSSALLVLALQQSRSGAAAVGIDQLVGSNFVRSENGLSYINDTWGKPLQLFIFPTANAASTSDLNGGSDPQDPEGLLLPFATSKWQADPTLGFTRLLHPQVTNRRLIPIIGSAGPDGDLGGPFSADDDDSVKNPTGDRMRLDKPGAFDNIYSFRLRQTGARGD